MSAKMTSVRPPPRIKWIISLLLFLSWTVDRGVLPAAQAEELRSRDSAALRSASPPPSQVSELLLRTFGGAAEVLLQKVPTAFVGDFNGDGKPDLVVLIRWAGGPPPPGVTQLAPWPSPPGRRAKRREAVSARQSSVALALFHGQGAAGWRQPQQVFLLMAGDRLSSPIFSDPEGGQLAVVRKGTRRGAGLPPARRGDVLRIPTEAGIDTFLYWDGKTYSVYEPQEEP